MKRPKINKEFSLTYREVKRWQALLFTFLIMSALILFVYFLSVPNPNMILIAGLVICSSFFGFSGGIPAALIMIVYTLYFFSQGNDFVTFSKESLYKVSASLFGIIVDMAFVCYLENKERLAFKQIKLLSDKLKEENETLTRMSYTDALTNIGNRLALRRDTERFIGSNVLVIMIDIDNFKSINDNHGHYIGDEILKATGKLLADTFGRDKSYRFGGDEFVVAISSDDCGKYIEMAAQLSANSPSFTENGTTYRARLAIGYAEDTVSDEHFMEALIDKADKLMYMNKSKNKAL